MKIRKELKLKKLDGALIFGAKGTLEVVIPAPSAVKYVGDNIADLTIVASVINANGKDPMVTKVFKKYTKKFLDSMESVREEKKKTIAKKK